ncbi:MAG: ABC transporter substrate-binding protein [Deltaproteobacteria bacterium]|nr:ABC transporter substrate-binding protein [Deltaproteobacteria bacterium]
MDKAAEKEQPRQNFSRREFIKTSALTVGAASVLSVCGQVPAQAADKPKELPLSMAGYKFDRTKALIDGRIKIEGCDMQFQESGIGDINTHVFSGPQTLDVTEIGLHPFMLAYANDGFRDYSLLPIFPLRLFRHKSVFIRTDRNIKKPEDLRGKTIATTGYSSTSLTWIRGILQEEYGIKPEDMRWIVSSKDSSAKDAGKVSKQENIFSEGVSINMGPAGKDESDLLESGKVDALFHAGEPRAYIEGHPKVGRLFPDYRSVERAYFSKTGIFPIMHAVAIKKSLVKKTPWLIEAVFKAYSQSKQMAYNYMANAAWFKDSLPWFGQEFEETRASMGDNYYSYGIESNRKTLEALFRYSHQQGLCSRELTIEELFEPASLKLTESQT